MNEAEKKEVSKRLKEFRKIVVKKNQAALAEEAGVTQKTISFYENGRWLPGTELITYLEHHYKLNGEWLRTGVGGLQKHSTIDQDVNRLKNTVADQEQKILALEKKLEQVLKMLEKSSGK